MDPKISARDIILMWGSPDDGVVVREYVIGWGESGPYEQTARASNDAHFFRITGLGESFRCLRSPTRNSMHALYAIFKKMQTIKWTF